MVLSCELAAACIGLVAATDVLANRVSTAVVLRRLLPLCVVLPKRSKARGQASVVGGSFV